MSLSNLNISIEKEQLSLYKVSLSGDVVALEALLQEDELILDRVSLTNFHETPLHIAAMRGHLQFARALVSRKPKLANEKDSLGRLPLHLASAEGYVDMVKELLHASPDAWSAQDEDGSIPLHLAVMKERIHVIKELVEINPESVTQKLNDGGTILHLCIKYNRLEALRILVEHARDDEFVNDSDYNGNTILHLAAIHKQVETTKYLLMETSIKTKATALNRNGFTALDAVEHTEPKDSKGLEIQIMLLEAGVQRTLNNLPPPPSSSAAIAIRGWNFSAESKLLDKYFKNVGKWLEEARGNILVAATVAASITFQAGINPPKIKKEDKDDNNVPKHINIAPAPASVFIQPDLFIGGEESFWTYNSAAMMLSLTLMLLMLSGIPLKNKFATYILVAVMWFTVFCISLAYSRAVELDSSVTAFMVVIYVSLGLILFVHTVSSLIYLFWKMWRCFCKLLAFLCSFLN